MNEYSVINETTGKAMASLLRAWRWDARFKKVNGQCIVRSNAPETVANHLTGLKRVGSDV
jgi:hypothetical protein